MIEVQTELPTILGHSSRIAFIGGCPNPDDETTKRPFSGHIGNYLSQAINAAGILRSTCLMGNVSNIRLPFKYSMDTWAITEGRARLTDELQAYKPNLIVLLGDLPLRIAGVTESSRNMRGSLFTCVDRSSPFYNYKCLATINPADVIKQFDLFPLFCFDMERAKTESTSPDLDLPNRVFELHCNADEICRKLADWPDWHPAAFDIEGYATSGITCMAVADSPNHAFIIDWKNMNDKDKPRVWNAVRNFLRNPRIPKIAHNILYELFCIGWRHKMAIANLHWDTMISAWEIYPELPKSLAMQTSLWTREPFYKAERKIPDDVTHHRYCCKDATVTYEIYQAHQAYLTDNPSTVSRGHFDLNMDLVPIFAYIELKGIKYDVETAQEMINDLKVEMDETQTRIDLFNGEPLNVNSPKQMINALYNRHRYQPQYQKEGNRNTTKLTCDVVALLTLLRKHNTDLLFNILKWRQLEGLRKQLETTIDKDNRIRCSYTIVGTETGRFNCSGSNNDTGYNLQTVTKRLRKLFLADDDHYMFQLDLAGADGWTVAAHSANLGDSRMLDDMLYGIKPARTICALYLTKDKSLAHASPAHLDEVIKSLTIPEWLYAAAKAVQHGSSYGMGKPTMSSNILKQSWKISGNPIFVEPKACGELQDLFFLRYTGVQKYQTWVKLQLENKGFLNCASGHIRNFLGRRTDNATLQAAYSHEPQANTTYVTSLGVRKLWLDPENRDSRGNPIIQPLHQVHDALLGQFPRAGSAGSVAKLRQYFTNPITIANIEINIPFEGEYGLYWGDKSGGII